MALEPAVPVEFFLKGPAGPASLASMFFSLSRRILLFLAFLFLVSFSLIFVHDLQQGNDLSWPLAAGAGCSLLVLLWNWAGIVKTDDYIIPRHARIFFIVTASVVGCVGFTLCGFFLIADDYPSSYLLYFGILPAIVGGAYILFAVIGTREAFALPREYRPTPRPVVWGILPCTVSLFALAIAAGALALATRELVLEPRPGASAEETGAPNDPDSTEPPVRAEDLYQLAKAQQGQDAYRHAFTLFQKAAVLGHTEADYELGLIHNGDGYLRDVSLAYQHFQRARSEGHLEATFLLGRAYRHGELGLSPDYTKAREYLETAAQAGHLEAQTQLGHLYNRGQGMAAPDEEKAFYWFKKAAEQGDPIAQNDLGIFYLNGTGTEPNAAEGLRWLKEAADGGATVAQYNLGRSLYEGVLVPQDYPAAFALFTKLTEKGVAYGFQMIGLHHFHGHGVAQDYEAAVEAFSQGAARGNDVSAFYLGRCYLEGLGVEKDSESALPLLEQAAAQAHTEAQLLLGRLYLEGSVILRDRAQAATWFRTAAESGSEEAAAELEALERILTEEERAEVTVRYKSMTGRASDGSE